MGYDGPDYQIRREYFFRDVGGVGQYEYAKFRSFQASRLKKVHAIVTVPGTSDEHGFDIYHGTTSIGTILLGTKTVDEIAHSELLDEKLPSLDQISVKSLDDAAGHAQIVYEYEITPDAVAS
jgi:hypothetical protein